MPVPPGRPRDPAADSAILRATVELIQEVGIAQLTTRDIARRAGVGRQTLYRRWASKDELVAAACGGAVGLALELPDTGAVRDDIIAILSALASRLEVPSQARLVRALVAARLSDADADRLVRNLHEQSRDATVEVLRRAVARGELPADVDEDLLAGMLYGVIYHRLLVSGEPVHRRLVEPVVDAALRTPPRRPS